MQWLVGWTSGEADIPNEKAREKMDEEEASSNDTSLPFPLPPDIFAEVFNLISNYRWHLPISSPFLSDNFLSFSPKVISGGCPQCQMHKNEETKSCDQYKKSKLQISDFYFPTIKKTDCTIFTQLVRPLVGVTSNFPSPNCVTQPHTDQVPPYTIHCHTLMTQYHHVPTSTAFYSPSTSKYLPMLCFL